MIDVSASGDSADRVVDAGRQIDEDINGTERQLVADNPILDTMGRIAREHGVSVTLSVYPVDPDDENEVVDENGEPIDE